MYSDEDDDWLDSAEFCSRYLPHAAATPAAVPQTQAQVGGGVAGANVEDDPQEGSSAGTAAAEEHLPILNKSGDVDTTGSPFPMDHYESIPLSDNFKDVIDILIKKVSFVRQERFHLEDQLHRYELSGGELSGKNTFILFAGSS